jgi:hypothetical protein
MKVKITQLGTSRAVVEVNGRDMAPWISAYHVHADVEDGPQVVLQFSGAVLPEFDGPAEVQVTPDLHEALIHLGWTPPAPAEEVTEREVSAHGDPQRTFIRSDGTRRYEDWPGPIPTQWAS